MVCKEGMLVNNEAKTEGPQESSVLAALAALLGKASLGAIKQ